MTKSQTYWGFSFATAMALVLAGCGPSKRHHNERAAETEDGDSVEAQSKTTGTLRGLFATNTLVNERLLVPGQAVKLVGYLQPQSDGKTFLISELQQPSSLGDLLGYYDGTGIRSGFYNAKPNPMNMLLWYSIIDSLATDLARLCGGAPAVDTGVRLITRAMIKPAILGAVDALCAGVAAVPAAVPEAALDVLWEQLVAADAPLTEEFRWRRSAAEASDVREIIVSALYSPYFLLR